MLDLTFTKEGWEQYLYWQTQDKRTLKRINTLIKDCRRNPYDGIGKPEPLHENLRGSWSRQIDEKHRLVYVVTDTQVQIYGCRTHYGEK
ncbi:Txe/YoeB family addiction module toxin [Candidatus Saccharibacteria bacterium CG_4_10_14_0_2_um_filter_52_9]|nr:MAG: Txe/YoeB family addiction module toxin [Candidatus Saccharibacteria bacterium CG_4_10_14_0_2_um_filter_52_9]